MEYKNGFVWFDESKKDEYKSYHFQIADVIDGKLVAVPKAIFAAAMNLLTGSDEEVKAVNGHDVQVHLEQYFSKMGLVSPWLEGEHHFFGVDEIKSMDRRAIEQNLISTGAFSRAGAKLIASRYSEPVTDIVAALQAIHFD